LAHSPVDPLHLPVNLSLLVAFGGMTERRLSRRGYYWFLAVAGLASTAGQVAGAAIAASGGDASGTLGASGIALAATGFAVVASARRWRVTGEWEGQTTWLWTAVGAVVLARRLVLDIAVGVPNVGRYGHLWGALFGVTFALLGWRTTVE
jgi:membrane associated rhomboid family serine protease